VLGTRDDSGKQQSRENASKSGDHDKVLLVVLPLVIAGLDMDPAIGGPGSER